MNAEAPFILIAVLRRSVLRVCGAHLRVIAPRQHSYTCAGIEAVANRL